MARIIVIDDDPGISTLAKPFQPDELLSLVKAVLPAAPATSAEGQA